MSKLQPLWRSPLNHLTFRKIFTFLKFHTKISFSEMFALLDIRLTPLTVLLGQKTCCKSLKITSPDRICHFVITKTTTGSWKVLLLTRKQHCENVSLFLNLCYKKIPQHESFLSQLHLQMTEKCGGVFCSERWKLDTHRVWHISKVAVSVEYSQKESVL